MSSFISSSGLTYLWSKIKEYISAHTGTYSKPSTGIPKTDLASAVQTSLGKADTALQSYTESDPVFAASAAHGITSSDITNWNSKTSNVGTITGINMNGASKGTSGVVDLGTVITEHQDISGKANTSDLDNYLPLTGGTLTGNVTTSGNIYMNNGSIYMSNYKYIYMKDSGGTNREVMFLSTTNNFHIGFGTAGAGITTFINGNQIYFRTGTSRATAFMATSDGKVGIGTETPSALLEVAGNASITGTLTLGGNPVAVVYSGSTAPSSSTGSNGDIYIQTT